jgi:hypothetical protein
MARSDLTRLQPFSSNAVSSFEYSLSISGRTLNGTLICACLSITCMIFCGSHLLVCASPLSPSWLIFNCSQICQISLSTLISSLCWKDHFFLKQRAIALLWFVEKIIAWWFSIWGGSSPPFPFWLVLFVASKELFPPCKLHLMIGWRADECHFVWTI